MAKSQEVKNTIRDRLHTAIIFKALNDDELNVIIDAMEEKKFDAGATIITEGEAGSVLYLVGEG